MVDPDETYLAKARQSLAGARAELEAGRYSNSANRSYYGVFQAAIYAILNAAIKQAGSSDVWNHGWVGNQVNGILVNRRHRYSPDLRSVLGDNYKLRVQADYSPVSVSEIAAIRAVRRAERFVEAVARTEDSP